MKALKTLALTALLCGGIMSAQAQLLGGGSQKIVYVDSEYIMENIPEYGDAQEELNALSAKWQAEVKAIYDKVEEMYSKYQTEMLLLSEDQKRAREQAIRREQEKMKASQEQANSINDTPKQPQQQLTRREPVQRTQPVRAEKKPGRNDPCPCGSGKKYKNCHGKDSLE